MARRVNMAPPPNQMLMRVYHLLSTTSPLGRMIPARWHGSRMAVESVRQCNGRTAKRPSQKAGSRVKSLAASTEHPVWSTRHCGRMTGKPEVMPADPLRAITSGRPTTRLFARKILSRGSCRHHDSKGELQAELDNSRVVARRDDATKIARI